MMSVHMPQAYCFFLLDAFESFQEGMNDTTIKVFHWLLPYHIFSDIYFGDNVLFRACG